MTQRREREQPARWTAEDVAREAAPEAARLRHDAAGPREELLEEALPLVAAVAELRAGLE